MSVRSEAIKFGGVMTVAVGVAFGAAAHAKSPKGKYISSGRASWYGEEMAKGWKNGRPVFNKTASGQPFNPDGISAAHKTLPLPSCIIVETKNGKTLRVNVNDRGPYARGRILDLSRGAAERLGVKGQGEFHVTMYHCPK